MFLNLEISDEDEKDFLAAKEKSGIKSNTDFLRYMIKRFIFNAYGSYPQSKFKIMNASDIDINDPLNDFSEIEATFRRGFMHGFVYCKDTSEDKRDQVLDILYDWRFKESTDSMVPPCVFISERLKD